MSPEATSPRRSRLRLRPPHLSRARGQRSRATRLKERLAQQACLGEARPVSEPAFDRNDANAIVAVPYDMKLLLLRIVELLGGEVDGEEKEEDADEP